MNTLSQLGWGVLIGLWWVSGLIIFLFVILLIFKASPGIEDAKKFRMKLRQHYKSHRIDKSEYERLTHSLAEEDSLYEN